MKLDDQIRAFHSLGYEFREDVTKEIILREVYESSHEDETETYIEQNPFSVLYYVLGSRGPEIAAYNFSDKCIWFDLEFFDPKSQYKWFMERMGAITDGEITFSKIVLEEDEDGWEWISFEVNGTPQSWRLQKTGLIADHYVALFGTLHEQLKTKGRYTYFCNGGQQWVIDYATEEEQIKFNAETGLDREWLDETTAFQPPNETKKSPKLDHAEDVETRIKVIIQIEGTSAGHELAHGYRETFCDPNTQLSNFLQDTIQKADFPFSSWSIETPSLSGVLSFDGRTKEFICLQNVTLGDLMNPNENKLTVDFRLNTLNDEVIRSRIKSLRDKGVTNASPVEAAWLGMDIQDLNAHLTPENQKPSPAPRPSVPNDDLKAKPVPAPNQTSWFRELLEKLRRAFGL